MLLLTPSVRPGRPAFASLLASILFLLLLTAASSFAANITLSGSCSWQISGTTINLSAARVDNDSTSGTSGSLRLQVWATKSPYAGGTISGYVLGTRALNPLQAGYYYSGISGAVTYRPPPAGAYYTTMTVEEYTGTGYVIRDYLTFSGTSQLGSGGVTPGGTGTIDLVNSVGWSTSGSLIDIKATKILNGRSSGTSGTLRLQVWATKSPYAGGTINGYIMGTRTLGTLAAGYSYNNIAGQVPFTAPPAGTYYTTLTLEEYQNGSYVIIDYVTFSSTSTFGPAGGGTGNTPGVGPQILGAVKFKLSLLKGANLRVDRVSNLSTTPGARSGTLRLRLWATSVPYSGGNINGYVLATHSLGQLYAGQSLDKIKANVTYTRPPGGRYFVVMTLEEYQNGSYTIVDSINFRKLLKVK